ncbi:hypothetical protein K435DRAFT_778277 [Dendrothele bispora CBS 962.96]|uniref:Coenzyme Q-binding protein COQ10 START domain-containing protein n=1 Tax=Dendrothele bispora (strain CBS 962.96) TaxID=1314807 RepID=A0A4S8M4N2_DENBC|nr:hypothetical protein K435DRAFT_778277 [Dendrothele bispora CBS 962.96]
MFNARLLLSLVFIVPFATAQSSSPPSNLPTVDPGVFSAEASILINGTVEQVWDVLTDFPSYPEWNPFVRSQVVTNKLLVPESSQEPVEDKRLIITSQIPPLDPPVSADTPSNPLNTHITIENITHVQPELKRVAWKLYGSPDSVLSAERWSAVSAFQDENGINWAFYESREVYNGALASLVQSLEGEGLAEAFEAQAQATKLRVEGM